MRSLSAYMEHILPRLRNGETYGDANVSLKEFQPVMVTNYVKQNALEKLLVVEKLKNFSHISTTFLWHYSPWWTLASSKIVLHVSESCDLRIQFLVPIFFRSSPTDSSQLNLCFSTRRLPSGLRRVSFL